MSETPKLSDTIYTFSLGYLGCEMQDLPDLMRVYKGVDIRIDLGNIIGGWTLGGPNGDEPIAVYFMLMSDGEFHQMHG